ncbi:hypothetical protein OG588_34865 [Streptomyces prunicolor]|uniref:hypothetical protein n=1 Tax=Streptomyces prunicolor TaxID=67348 RepID=UPI0038635EFA|nr:hypothetical protein OG588_34865 [Streptomyces prunicolor]
MGPERPGCLLPKAGPEPVQDEEEAPDVDEDGEVRPDDASDLPVGSVLSGNPSNG